MPAATAAKPVHEAWLDVMTAVQSIGKHDRNTDQNFVFRGIDATMNAVGPALRDARIFIRPRRIVDRAEERYETKRGTSMRNVTLTIEWEVTGPAGDSFTAETVGEAADSGDKAVSKAHSVAYRTLLLQSLCVPTGDADPDSTSHERAGGGNGNGNGYGANTDPRREGWQSISAKGRQLGLNEVTIRTDYRERMGHEIDGPEATVETLRTFYDGMTAQPQASDPDPWTTAAPGLTTLPLPDNDTGPEAA